MRHVQIIQVPYDSGYKDYRMGQGPKHILHHLQATQPYCIEEVLVQDHVALEIGTSFAVASQLAERVSNAIRSGAFPLVLAGNCISCVGTIAGLGLPSPAIIWLDAHGDFNTPETTESGFLDGMGLATAVGRCWHGLATNVSGFHPVPEKQVVLVGAGESDSAECVLLEHSEVQRIHSQSIRDRGADAGLEPALINTRRFTDRAYLHIDLDVLDVAEAHVNEFSARDGLTLTELLAVVASVRKHFAIAAAAITAYDPAYDRNGRGVRAAEAIIRELVEN